MDRREGECRQENERQGRIKVGREEVGSKMRKEGGKRKERKTWREEDWMLRGKG